MDFFLELLTWFFLGIIFYTYIGYGILLGLMVKLSPRTREHAPSYLPGIAHIIPAYNEEAHLREKIRNSLSLSYPAGKHRVIVVTDGSDDNSASIANQFDNILHLHYPERRGKVGAINRALSIIHEEVVVISDANAMLNEMALRNLVAPFNDEQTGVVAGEKRVLSNGTDAAGTENLYWKYESKLKEWDAQLYSVVGAAGELLAVRAELLDPLDEEIILEDFYISLDLASRGFRTAYAPDAWATEDASDSIRDELTRKIRIAAGGFQAMWKLRRLFNIFRYGILSFQFISHRVLRWTLAPLGLLVVFVCSGMLAIQGDPVYFWLLICQLACYALALTGAIFMTWHVRIKVIFVPFYFLMMNYAVYLGFLRFVRGKQSAVWKKSRSK